MVTNLAPTPTAPKVFCQDWRGAGNHQNHPVQPGTAQSNTQSPSPRPAHQQNPPGLLLGMERANAQKRSPAAHKSPLPDASPTRHQHTTPTNTTTRPLIATTTPTTHSTQPTRHAKHTRKPSPATQPGNGDPHGTPRRRPPHRIATHHNPTPNTVTNLQGPRPTNPPRQHQATQRQLATRTQASDSHHPDNQLAKGPQPRKPTPHHGQEKERTAPDIPRQD